MDDFVIDKLPVVVNDDALTLLDAGRGRWIDVAVRFASEQRTPSMLAAHVIDILLGNFVYFY